MQVMHSWPEILHRQCCVLHRATHLEMHDGCLTLIVDVNFDNLIKVLSAFSAAQLLFILIPDNQPVGKHFKCVNIL